MTIDRGRHATFTWSHRFHKTRPSVAHMIYLPSYISFLFHPSPNSHCKLPALPIWKISPLCASSLRSTGHDVVSALASVTSSFVPSILKVVFSGLMAAKRGTSVVYRLGVASDVTRSRSILLVLNLTVDLSLTIFLRKKDAMTVVEVW